MASQMEANEDMKNQVTNLEKFSYMSVRIGSDFPIKIIFPNHLHVGTLDNKVVVNRELNNSGVGATILVPNYMGWSSGSMTVMGGEPGGVLNFSLNIIELVCLNLIELSYRVPFDFFLDVETKIAKNGFDEIIDDQPGCWRSCLGLGGTRRSRWHEKSTAGETGGRRSRRHVKPTAGEAGGRRSRRQEKPAALREADGLGGTRRSRWHEKSTAGETGGRRSRRHVKPTAGEAGGRRSRRQEKPAALREADEDVIATFIGKPVMLDLYTNSVTIGISSLTGDDFTKETIRVEYKQRPPKCDECKIFGHVHDHCPKMMVNPPIVTTSNVVTPTIEKSNDGFQTVGKKKKRKGKPKPTNGSQFTSPSVKQSVRYEPKATTIAPKKGATNVSNPSKSSSMLKTADTSPKNDNFTTSNSFSTLNDEEVENVYD
nr:hypothetical protein [Tanacetum cinerariifolium]